MRCVYLMPNIPWPLLGGREISAHYLLRSLVQRGHDVRVLVQNEPTLAELAAWPLADRLRVETIKPSDGAAHRGRGFWRRRWLGYWGTHAGLPAAVADAVVKHNPDYVEAAGLEVLPWVMDIAPGVPCLWLAADDACLFNLSILARRRGVRDRLATIMGAIQMAAYERSFASLYDAAVVASPLDRAAMKLAAGFRHIQIVPNGVDHDYFSPPSQSESPDPYTAIFWGRLDFQPNIDAIEWFALHIWPHVHRRHPNAVWRILGRSAAPEIVQLAAQTPGVELIGEVSDIRPWVCRASVSIMPMRNGTGIKNKLLEAAAMARPIIATATATRGLMWDHGRPWLSAKSPLQWIGALSRLWNSPQEQALLGGRARAWVRAKHDWDRAAVFRENFVAARRSLRVDTTEPARIAIRRAA